MQTAKQYRHIGNAAELSSMLAALALINSRLAGQRTQCMINCEKTGAASCYVKQDLDNPAEEPRRAICIVTEATSCSRHAHVLSDDTIKGAKYETRRERHAGGSRGPVIIEAAVVGVGAVPPPLQVAARPVVLTVGDSAEHAEPAVEVAHLRH